MQREAIHALSFAESVLLARELPDDWYVVATLAQGFRAPNLSDLTKLDDTSAVEVPSPLSVEIV